MAIEFKEAITNKLTYHNTAIPLKESNVDKNINKMKKNSNNIFVDVEALHAGPTGNYTWYMEEAIDGSIPTWTKPYEKPVIKAHKEEDGETIGRVFNAYKKLKNTRSGTPALLLSAYISETESKQEILDGRLKTTSIGVIATDVRCSICGAQITLDEYGHAECGHDKGHIYEYNGSDQICYWQIYDMIAKELSYVNVPSDMYAHNIRVYDSDNQTINCQEGLVDSNNTNQINLQEGVKETMGNPNPVKTEDVNNTTKVDPQAEVQATPEKQPESVKETAAETSKETIDLQKQVEELNAEIVKLKEKNKELESKNTAANQSLSDTKVLLQSATDKLNTVSASLQHETALRESAENSLIDLKKQIKQPKFKELNDLRAKVGLEALSEEKFNSRTLESINDSILDLQESLKIKENNQNVKTPMPNAEDPTLKTQNDVNFKESKDNNAKSIGNIDLNENYNEILNLVK